MPTEINELKYVVFGLQSLKKLQARLIKVAGAQAQLAASMSKTNVSAIRSKTGVTEWTKEGHKLITTTTLMGKKVVAVARHLDTTATRFKKLSDSTNRGARAAKSFGITWQGIGRIIIGSTISRGIGAVIRSLSEGISTAKDFSIAIGEIRTIAQDNQLGFQQWAGAVRALSDEFGNPILNVAEAQYQTLSSQIAKGAESLGFLADAQRLAVITVSSTSTAVNVLSGSLKAYGKGAEEAERFTDILFKTIELGKIRLKDFEGKIGSVAIVGAQLGVTFKEVNAAISTLTRKGLSAPLALTGLRNIFQKLIKPTKKMKELFAEWNVISGAAAIESFGFVGVLNKLFQAAEASADPLGLLGEAFGRIRATVGGLGLVFSDFTGELKKFDTAAEDAAGAFELAFGASGKIVDVELNKLKNIFIEDFGGAVIDTLATISKSLGGIEGILEPLTGAFKTLGFIGTTALGVGIYGAGKKLLQLMVLLTTTTVGLVPIFVAVAVAVFFRIQAMSDRATSSLKKLTGSAILESEKRVKAITKEATETVRIVNESIDLQIKASERFGNALENRKTELAAILEIQQKLEGNLLEAELAASKSPIQKIRLVQDALNKNARTLGDINLITAEGIDLARDTYLERLKLQKLLISNLPKKIKITTPLAIHEQRGSVLKKSKTRTITKEALEKKQALENLKIIEFITAQANINKATREHTIPIEKKVLDLITKEKSELALIQELNKKALEDARAFASEGDTLFIKGRDAAIEFRRTLPKFMPPLIALQKAFDTRGLGIPNETLNDWENIQSILTQLHKLKEAPPTEGNIRLLGTVLARLELVSKTDAAKTIFSDAAIKLIPTIAETIQRAANLSKEAQRLRGTAKIGKDGLDVLKEKMEAFRNTLKFVSDDFGRLQVNTGANLRHMSDDAQFLLDKYREIGRAIKFANEQALQRPGSLPRNPDPKVPGTWTGGAAKRYAGGGSVASDRISALLAPGEFVTNAQQSRKFLPQLTTLNSNAARFNEGGIVNNNNVGDINVSVQGGSSSKDTVREIASGLRREFRRGTIRLN